MDEIAFWDTSQKNILKYFKTGIMYRVQRTLHLQRVHDHVGARGVGGVAGVVALGGALQVGDDEVALAGGRRLGAWRGVEPHVAVPPLYGGRGLAYRQTGQRHVGPPREHKATAPGHHGGRHYM